MLANFTEKESPLRSGDVVAWKIDDRLTQDLCRRIGHTGPFIILAIYRMQVKSKDFRWVYISTLSNNPSVFAERPNENPQWIPFKELERRKNGYNLSPIHAGYFERADMLAQ